jgi:SPP1 family predicted phage head-tail adaptor
MALYFSPDPGDLNRQITFQAPSRVADAMGSVTTTYVDVCTVWAAINPLIGREAVETLQEMAQISHRILVRYRRNVKPSWRIKYGTRYFNIVSIMNPAEDRKALEILCKEAIE